MLLWIAILVILYALSQFYRYNPLIFWSSVIILILLAGFRDVTMGVDTRSYKPAMEYVSMGISPYKEYGWNKLNWFIINHGKDFHMLTLLASILTIVPVALVFVRSSANPQFSLFVYYAMFAYLNSFNGMRQFIAISFILVAYMFFIEDKKIWTLIFIFLAYQFHHSAWYSVIVFALPYIKLNKDLYVYLLLIVTLALGCVFNANIFKTLSFGYSSYVDSSNFGYRDSFLWGFILSLLMNGLFVYMYIKTEASRRNSLIFKIFFLSILINNTTFRLVLGARLILYFTIIQTLLFPRYFNYRYQYTRWIILTYLTVLFLKILNSSGGFVGGVYPYKSVISQYIYY